MQDGWLGHSCPSPKNTDPTTTNVVLDGCRHPDPVAMTMLAKPCVR